MVLSAEISGVIQYANPISSDAYRDVTDRFNRAFRAALDFGTGPGQIAKAYADHKVVTTGGTFNYDLSALPGGQGMTAVRFVYLEALSDLGTVGSGVIGPGASNGWTNGMGGNVPIVPKSLVLMGWPDAGAPAVGAGSNERVTVTVTGILEYLIVFLGY